MKYLLTTLLLILIQFTANAQDQKIRIGFDAGPNIVSLRGNEVLEKFHSNRTSFIAGMHFQFNISNRFSIRSGIYYEDKGSSIVGPFYDINGNTIPGEGITSFKYLNLPLLFRLTFGDKLRYYFNTGPYVGLLRSSETTFTTVNINGVNGQNDGTEAADDFDYGLSFGAGTEYPITESIILSFEVRHNYGLYNISTTSVIDDGEINTNSTNFILGVSFLLGS